VNLDLFKDPQTEPSQRLAELGKRRRDLLGKQREAQIALEAARGEHEQVARDLEDRDAKALALGQDAPTKTDRDKLAKLVKRLDEHDDTAARLARAIELIDEEARRTVSTEALTLFNEANEMYNAARVRIAELTAELHERHAEMRAGFAIAQRVLSGSGHHRALRGLRDVPSVEQIMRDGLEPNLLASDDFEAFGDELHPGIPTHLGVPTRRNDAVNRLLKLRRKHPRTPDESRELEHIARAVQRGPW
jgi:hypothetical protein